MRGSEDAIELSVTMNKAIVTLHDPQGSMVADRADRVFTRLEDQRFEISDPNLLKF